MNAKPIMLSWPTIHPALAALLADGRLLAEVSSLPATVLERDPDVPSGHEHLAAYCLGDGSYVVVRQTTVHRAEWWTVQRCADIRQLPQMLCGSPLERGLAHLILAEAEVVTHEHVDLTAADIHCYVCASHHYVQPRPPVYASYSRVAPA